ncbi:39S ribosomal protein L41, mitochondrial [Aethina tumida]|uniref:39S ribosomal protein L41, mitochondrial n=1 Tax=Aethina tumida TaxID=116153 RepID=UPI00096B2C64|nr:39S ribosomal protein L41, mitochondrial [Aethina tumida]
MNFVNLIITRGISTSCVRNGKRNFRKFQLPNKRGSRQFKEARRLDPNPDIPIDKRGVRDTGYYLDGKFIHVPEKVPELIVPDLTGFKLQPYVSYRTPDVVQTEFTAEDLFNVVYAPKIVKDFNEGKLDADGNPLNPSAEEKLTAEEAKIKARQTGSDIFQ